MYKLIDEELRISSCSVNDLPKEMVEQLKPLETLILFYDSSDDMVVLNQDNRYLESFLTIITTYMLADHKTRTKIKENLTPLPIGEVIEILDSALLEREAKKVKLMLNKHTVGQYVCAAPVLRRVLEQENPELHMYDMFTYGYILGQRAERARRKDVK